MCFSPLNNRTGDAARSGRDRKEKEMEDALLHRAGKIAKDDKMFKFILKCQKNHYKPDLHSFSVTTKRGTAFVDCRKNEVYIESYDEDCKKTQWCGPAVAAAGRLDRLGADYDTIDM